MSSTLNFLTDYITEILTKYSNISDNDLDKKYWIKKPDINYHIRSKYIELFDNRISKPKKYFKSSKLFNLLRLYNFEYKGILVLSGFNKLKRDILDNIDIDTLILTTKPGIFYDSHNKTIIQDFDNIENKIHCVFDLYIYDFVDKIDYELLKLPFKLITKGEIDTLPYIIIFTDILGEEDYLTLTETFGKVEFPLFNLPELKIYDYRETIKDRGYGDINYTPLDENEVIDYYKELLMEKKTEDNNSLLIVCNNFNYAAIEFVKLMCCPCLVINDYNEIYQFEINDIPDYYFNEQENICSEDEVIYDLSEFCEAKHYTLKELKHLITNSELIVMSKHFFKEFVEEDIQFKQVLLTNFKWDIKKRIDMIKRFHYYKTNTLYTYSDIIPYQYKHKKITINYNLDYQNKLFRTYNVKFENF